MPGAVCGLDVVGRVADHHGRFGPRAGASQRGADNLRVRLGARGVVGGGPLGNQVGHARLLEQRGHLLLVGRGGDDQVLARPPQHRQQRTAAGRRLQRRQPLGEQRLLARDDRLGRGRLGVEPGGPRQQLVAAHADQRPICAGPRGMPCSVRAWAQVSACAALLSINVPSTSTSSAVRLARSNTRPVRARAWPRSRRWATTLTPTSAPTMAAPAASGWERRPDHLHPRMPDQAARAEPGLRGWRRGQAGERPTRGPTPLPTAIDALKIALSGISPPRR